VVQDSKKGVVNIGDVPAPDGAHTITVDPSTHDVWVCYGDPSSAHFARFIAKK
jgi:hypothetical protein